MRLEGGCLKKRIIIHEECNKIRGESLILQPNSRMELRQTPERGGDARGQVSGICVPVA